MNNVIIGLSSGVVFLGLLIWILTWVRGKADKDDVNSCLAVLKADMEKDINLKANQEYVDAELRHGEKQFTSILAALTTTNGTIMKQAEALKDLCVAQNSVETRLTQMWQSMEKREQKREGN